MKVNAINNTNFKGLFTNKTEENNGIWRMEYHPYSWEEKEGASYYQRVPGMSRQEEVDFKSTDLPDNEKIFYTTKPYPGTAYYLGRESCKDILGTEFYMCDYDKNTTRKTITEMPAMNLEDSLRVKIEKLGTFLEFKDRYRKELEGNLYSPKDKIDSQNEEFISASRNYEDSVFGRKENKRKMADKHYGIMYEVDKTFKDMKEYFRFNDGIKSVVDLRQNLTEEADKLTKARETDNLIDISRRDIYDPNKPLWDAIQEMIRTKTLQVSKKLVALPHKSISMQEIIKAIGSKIKDSNASAEIIGYVDKLIASRK